MENQPHQIGQEGDSRCFNAVMAFLSQRQQHMGRSDPVTEQTPVFDHGLVDSLALVELVAAVETACGAEVDMLWFDPTQVDTVADLVAQLQGAMGQGGAC